MVTLFNFILLFLHSLQPLQLPFSSHSLISFMLTMSSAIYHFNQQIVTIESFPTSNCHVWSFVWYWRQHFTCILSWPGPFCLSFSLDTLDSLTTHRIRPPTTTTLANRWHQNSQMTKVLHEWKLVLLKTLANLNLFMWIGPKIVLRCINVFSLASSIFCLIGIFCFQFWMVTKICVKQERAHAHSQLGQYINIVVWWVQPGVTDQLWKHIQINDRHGVITCG